MPIDIESVVDATRYWIRRVRRNPPPVPKESILRRKEVEWLYKRLREMKRTYEFEQDEPFDILSPDNFNLRESAYDSTLAPYYPISPQQFARARGLWGPPPAAPGTNRTPPTPNQETLRWADVLEKRQSTPEGLLELENEHHERQVEKSKEITRLRQELMRYLLKDENLLVEAEIDWHRQIVSDWKLKEIEREAAKAQAAEDPTVGGGNGNEPEAKAGAAEASPKATRFRPGRLKGSGDGTMVVHLRDVEGVVDYDSVRQILGIEGVSKKQTTDMYSRSRAAHTAGCPVCVHRQPLPTKVADRLEQWKQRR